MNKTTIVLNRIEIESFAIYIVDRNEISRTYNKKPTHFFSFNLF